MEFRRWETPFENESIKILKVVYPADLGKALEKDVGDYQRTCLRVWLRTVCGEDYRLTFEPVVSFRVMDEIGFSGLRIPSDFYRESAHASPGQQGIKRLSSVLLRGSDWLDPHSSDAEWRYLLLTETDCIDVFASEVIVEASGID